MRSQDGQAVAEWVGIVLAVAILLAAAAAATVEAIDGRTLGGAIAHRWACAANPRCEGHDDALREQYGDDGAALVRRHLPGLVFEPGERQVPVDWRRCRTRACADAPDDRDLDVHRTAAGDRVTVFTRLVKRGGRTYVQYWTYYPDSNTTFAGSDVLWKLSPLVRLAARWQRGTDEYPGFHRDDWEAIAVRVGARGDVRMRVTSHGHWQSCKHRRCRDRWGTAAGWSRVSRGSHAGHVPLGSARERTSTADGIRLVPLESIDRRAYERLDPDIAPPWEKDVYEKPESSGS